MSDAGIWVPDCSAHRAVFHVQVLPVSAEEIEEITADAGCRASPLLCLSQDSLVDFLRPVRIQLPLPPGVTGQFIPKTGKEKHHMWKTTNGKLGILFASPANTKACCFSCRNSKLCLLSEWWCRVVGAEGSSGPADQCWASQTSSTSWENGLGKWISLPNCMFI